MGVSAESPQQQVMQAADGVERKAEIMQIAMDHGIEVDEPFWLVFQATGQLESLLLESVPELRSVSEQLDSQSLKAFSRFKKLQEKGDAQASQLEALTQRIEAIDRSLQAVQKSQREQSADLKSRVPFSVWVVFVLAWLGFAAVGLWAGRIEGQQIAGDRALAEEFGSADSARQWALIRARCVPRLAAGEDCVIEAP